MKNLPLTYFEPIIKTRHGRNPVGIQDDLELGGG